MKYILVPLILILLLSNCKKPPSCNGNYNALPDSVLNYWYFPTGSYWIYKAKGLDLYDSVYVTETRIENFDDDIDGALICAKNYSLIRDHSFYNCSISKYREKFSSKFIVGDSDLNIKPQFNNCPVNGYFPTLLFIKRVPKIPTGIIEKDTLINNVNYRNLLFNDELLLAPNVGVIKFELSDSLIWELIDYKISK